MDIRKYTKPARKALNLKLRPCAAVIVAAGTASRMGGIDKVMEPVGGEPMIVKTVRAFENCPAIRKIVIVTRPDLVNEITCLCDGFSKVENVVEGGKDRAESVANGLRAIQGRIKLVAVHDGARPLVSWELIDKTVRAANSYGAAAPGIPVKDTVKIVQGGLVESTPDRSTLQAIQTPQVFDLDLLLGALKKAREEGAVITDDCGAVERLGMKVKIVQGEERNIKITTPLDLKLAEAILEED